MDQFDGFWWLLLSMGPLFVIQRALHKELQGFLLLLTRRIDISLVIFSLLFLPGVFLHEISHFLMARLLLVRTGQFSLIPQKLGNGRLRLGYVETEEVGFLRDAFIGSAPLLTGMIFVGIIGKEKLGFLLVWQALNTLDLMVTIETLKTVIAMPNYWIWFYATVAISSTMLPSASDRRAWIPIAITVLSIIVVGIVIGLGPILLDSVVQPVNNIFRSMALTFAISTVVQVIVLLPIALVKAMLSRITGLRVS